MIKQKKYKYVTLTIYDEAINLLQSKEAWLPFLFYLRRKNILYRKYDMISNGLIHIYFNYVQHKFTMDYINNQTIHIGEIPEEFIKNIQNDSNLDIIKYINQNITIEKDYTSSFYRKMIMNQDSTHILKEESIAFIDQVNLLSIQDAVSILTSQQINPYFDQVAMMKFCQLDKSNKYNQLFWSNNGISRIKNKHFFSHVIKNIQWADFSYYKPFNVQRFDNGKHVLKTKKEKIALNLQGGGMLDSFNIYNSYYYISQEFQLKGNYFNWFKNKNAELLLLDITKIDRFKIQIKSYYEQEKLKVGRNKDRNRLETLSILIYKLNHNDYSFIKQEYLNQETLDIFDSNGVLIDPKTVQKMKTS